MDVQAVLNSIETLANEAAVLTAAVTRLRSLAQECEPLVAELSQLGSQRDALKAEIDALVKKITKKSK
jgi:phage shock protein A